MNLSIDDRALPRVIQAVERRNELLRMWTREVPEDYEEQLNEVHRIIAAAVTVAVRREQRGYGNVATDLGVDSRSGNRCLA